jgi:hypothetical protein
MYQALLNFNLSNLFNFGVSLFFIICFFIILFIIGDLIIEEINSKINKNIKWFSIFYIILSLFLIILSLIPSAVSNFDKTMEKINPEITENEIFQRLELEKKVSKNLTINLTQSNNKIINLENCLFELENKNQTNFKVCLTETKE